MSKEDVEVTVKLPEPVHNFYVALADSESKDVRKIMVDELTANVNMILESQETNVKNLVIHLLGLKKILE